MADVKNMTEGKPGKLIFHFALSLIVGNVFQQLYTFADTMIVGKLIGVNALAALGATEWLVFMMFGCVQGVTQGLSIGISQKFGSRDEEGLKKRIAHSVYLSAILTVALTFAGLCLCKPFLKLLNTPVDIIGYSVSYLRILYGAVAVSVLYNLLSAILRAAGDSKTPLKAVTMASLCNIVLDVLFVMVFRWGIEGAAAATVFSQLVSAVYCLKVLGKESMLWPDRKNFVPDFRCMKELILLGVPMGVQNIITACGGVMVQSVINGFGILFIAGFTAANKLYGLLEIAASSYGYAVASYTGQNMGAGLYERIRRGLKESALLGIVTAYLMSAVMVLFGRPILRCFVAGEIALIEQTVMIGYEFLMILAGFFPLLYLLYILRSCIQGMGNTLLPMISSIVQLLMRVSCAFILTKVIGQQGVFWGEIFAWIGADLLLYITYLYMMNSYTKKCGL